MEQETAASPETSDQSKPNKLIPLPDVGDIFFLDILYILLGVRPEYLFQDASVGWHLVAGKWILENHAIPQTDLFSYTFPDKTWIAYEWLFDVVIYVLTMLGGLNLLAVATGSLIALIILRTYDRTRFAGTPLLIAFVLMILGTFSSAIHWLARPHIVTMFGVYFFCKTLEQFYQSKISRKKLLALLIIMMVLWVNSHPAFLLGIAFVGLYMVCSCLSWFFYKGEPEGKGVRAQRAVTLIIALALVALATLINPYGLKLHAYIFDYLNSNQAILAATDEFRSPNFHNNISTAFFEALILLLITGLAVTEKRVSFPSISAVLAMLHLSLSAVRNIPFYIIVSLPIIGRLYSKTRLDGILPDVSGDPKEMNFFKRIYRLISNYDKQELQCKMRIFSILTVVLLVVASISPGFLGINLKTGFDPTRVPTTTLDYIRDHKLPFDRGFNFDNWGGYIRWKLDQRVFIDDRADFYGEPFYLEYAKVLQAAPDWNEVLDKYKVEWILMPKESPSMVPWKGRQGWRIASEDPAALLLVREKPLATPPAVAPTTTP